MILLSMTTTGPLQFAPSALPAKDKETKTEGESSSKAHFWKEDKIDERNDKSQEEGKESDSDSKHKTEKEAEDKSEKAIGDKSKNKVKDESVKKLKDKSEDKKHHRFHRHQD